jgi:hypothetical protein
MNSLSLQHRTTEQVPRTAPDLVLRLALRKAIATCRPMVQQVLANEKDRQNQQTQNQ